MKPEYIRTKAKYDKATIGVTRATLSRSGNVLAFRKTQRKLMLQLLRLEAA